MPELRCEVCYRESFILPIGQIILVYPTRKDHLISETKKCNVCIKHIEKIAQFLNLSTNPHIKLPRTKLNPNKQLRLSL